MFRPTCVLLVATSGCIENGLWARRDDVSLPANEFGEDVGDSDAPDDSPADTDDCVDEVPLPAEPVWTVGPVHSDTAAADAVCTDVGPIDWTLTEAWRYPLDTYVRNVLVAPSNGEPFASLYMDAWDRILVLDGRDGSERFVHSGIHTPEDDGNTPAVGDVDGDGAVDFVTTDINAFRYLDGATGVLTDVALPFPASVDFNDNASSDEVVSFVDVDLDGVFEIVLPNQVVRRDGELVAALRDTNESTGAFTADLTGDGFPEMCNGKGVWSLRDGSGSGWDREARPAGSFSFFGAPVRVGDEPRVVFTTVSRSGVVAVGRSNGAAVLGGVTGVRGIATASGDVDGDGAADTFFNIYDTDIYVSELVVADAAGNESRRWRYGDQLTGLSLADLDADGVYEILVLGTGGFRILDGRSGEILTEDRSLHAWAAYTAPVVADIDGDGSAEILVVADDALVALRPATGRWARTRRVWNQYAYDITSIRDDGRLVSAPRPAWSTYDAFRAQPGHDGVRPNVAVSVLSEEVALCDGGYVAHLDIHVESNGSLDVAAGTIVRLLEADPVLGLVTVAERVLPALPAGSAVDLEIDADPADLGALWVIDVVSPEADECDRTDDRAEGLVR